MPRRTKAQKAETALALDTRRYAVYRLKVAGAPFQKIGVILNISDRQAREDFKFVAEQLKQENLADLRDRRDLENARLDFLQTVIFSQVERGDLFAVNTALRISSERARLNGLYVPNQTEEGAARLLEMERRNSEPARHWDRLTEAELNLLDTLEDKLTRPEAEAPATAQVIEATSLSVWRNSD